MAGTIQIKGTDQGKEGGKQLILYTVVDPELIWKKEEISGFMEITYKGVRLEVRKISHDQVIVNRILSTDLTHYLDPGLQPGSMITFKAVSEL
jgi:hypothetical protein